VFHVVEILIAGDGTLTQSPFVNGSGECRGPSRLYVCRNKVTHIGSILSNIEEEATRKCAADRMAASVLIVLTFPVL